MNTKKVIQASLMLAATSLVWIAGYSICQEKTLVFPVPLETQVRSGRFEVDKSTSILIQEEVMEGDWFVSRMLSDEFVNSFGRVIKFDRQMQVPRANKFLLLGTLRNPLVRGFCNQHNLTPAVQSLGDAGYLLTVSDKNVVVAAKTNLGVFYGFESLRQIIRKENDSMFIPQLTIKDSAQYPFRGIKLYLPGRDNIPFFKRFVRDFVALYKFNKIILELNANMRLVWHPELNAGAVEFAKHLKYSRLGRPPGVHKEYQNSSHQDNADGMILEQDEVADLVKYIRSFNIEVIPELPSLTHSYYLLAGHKDLAENPNQEYPDTYCPLKPKIYNIYFDVLDEYINVIHPSMIHVGHDEWRMEKDLCDLCRGKDYNELYAKDLNTIHDYLSKKNIKIAIWGDHLLESVYGKNFQVWKSSSGYEYKIPASLRPDQVEKLIPKDILIFNWFWNDVNNDRQVSEFGFRQVYGNLRPDISQWNERKSIHGVLGGAPSSWAATTEYNFGKDQLFDFLAGANLLWSRHYVSVDSLALMSEPFISDIYRRMSGRILPSDNGCAVRPLNISAHLNSSLKDGIDSINVADLKVGEIKSGNKTYTLNFLPDQANRAAVVRTQKDRTGIRTVQGIEINEDVSSVMFLHACAKEAVNKKAYDMIFNFDDSAELLGWYEILYEDGFVETIPIRYGVNILDWNRVQRIKENGKEKVKYGQNKYAYSAAAVECSNDPLKPATFFAFEWENTRYGKKIKSINLKSVDFGKDNENAVILLAVSVAGKNRVTEATGSEAQ
jgi:hypothetical protein